MAQFQAKDEAGAKVMDLTKKNKALAAALEKEKQKVGRLMLLQAGSSAAGLPPESSAAAKGRASVGSLSSLKVRGV